MTIEVTTKFVSDRLVYVNMTRKSAEVDKDMYRAFNKANTDGDDKISEKEYNEYFKKSCSIEVQTVDKVCTKASAPRHYRKDILDNTQVDFYPDLELGNVTRGARNMYKLIDLDKNNKLSEQEIKEFNKARDLFEKARKQILEKSNKHGTRVGSSGIAGLATTLGGAYFALDGITIGGTFLGCIGPVGWGIAGVAAVGTAGYLLYETNRFTKECKAIEENLLKNTNNHPYVLEHLKDIRFYYD